MSATKAMVSMGEKIRRNDKSRLARECAELNKKFEQSLADEGLAGLKDEYSSKGTEKAWKKEALNRYKAFASGKVTLRRHAEVMRAALRLVKGKPK